MAPSDLGTRTIMGSYNMLFTKTHFVFEILNVFPFSSSTMCQCVFILLAVTQAMLLQYANVYAGTGHSNTKYNTTYNVLELAVSETYSADLQK